MVSSNAGLYNGQPKTKYIRTIYHPLGGHCFARPLQCWVAARSREGKDFTAHRWDANIEGAPAQQSHRWFCEVILIYFVSACPPHKPKIWGIRCELLYVYKFTSTHCNLQGSRPWPLHWLSTCTGSSSRARRLDCMSIAATGCFMPVFYQRVSQIYSFCHTTTLFGRVSAGKTQWKWPGNCWVIVVF